MSRYHLQGVVGCTHNSKGGVTLTLFHQLLLPLVVTHKLASAFVAFVNCKQTWWPLHPQQVIIFFVAIFGLYYFP
ncbi:hypothetical protein E2C01_081904 [Portunus trituberculatus]|uniref:Uncharacterized protein n=1 Tax=Portunus trituberculatus TaxID=210409 RepID=A0A5B7IX41_PORTR|nr:hypothetical protein [Portunus trituberculatus]